MEDLTFLKELLTARWYKHKQSDELIEELVSKVIEDSINWVTWYQEQKQKGYTFWG